MCLPVNFHQVFTHTHTDAYTPTHILTHKRARACEVYLDSTEHFFQVSNPGWKTTLILITFEYIQLMFASFNLRSAEQEMLVV